MGYHVIIDPECFPVKYIYVERLEDLVSVEGVNARSIVFQGNHENPPQQIGSSADLQQLSEDWYRAGMRAQVVFARMAQEQGLILEKLSQDQESFRAYTKTIKKPIKRGDFIIRNRENLEVEVKCRSFYGRGAQRYFLFSEEDLKKHLNMEKATHTSIVVAVFQRKRDKPVEDSLCMIPIDRIQNLAKQPTLREVKEYGVAYRILLSETVEGFQLLKEYGEANNERPLNILSGGYTLYANPEETPYVLVGYYKNQRHLEWILNTGLYNLRMGTDRGAVCLGKEESSARYILLHTKGETVTGKLFRILDNGPRVYARDLLLRLKYPGSPAHSFYLVYQVTPVAERKWRGKSWDISQLPGYQTGHRAAIPFAVPLSELLK